MKKGKKTISRLKTIFRSLQGGSSIVDACRAVGIDYTTLYSWEQKDERLKEKIESIIDSRVLVVEDKLYSRLVKGEASPTEYIFYLCNRAPHRWKRQDNAVIDQSQHFHFTSVLQQLRQVLNVESQSFNEGRIVKDIPTLPQ